MNSYQLAMVSHYSNLLPAIAFLLIYRRITPQWYPFVWVTALGIVNEFISQFWIRNYRSNMINSNIYVLLEFLLLLWQFARWQNRQRYFLYYAAAFCGIAVWVTDNFYLHSLQDNNSLFRLVYSSILVLFSIDRLNREIVYEKKQLLRNARFLICFTFMLYYGNKAFIESFNLYHLSISPVFYSRLWMILDIINILASFIYSFAILCIRPKTTLLLPY